MRGARRKPQARRARRATSLRHYFSTRRRSAWRSRKRRRFPCAASGAHRANRGAARGRVVAPRRACRTSASRRLLRAWRSSRGVVARRKPRSSSGPRRRRSPRAHRGLRGRRRPSSTEQRAVQTATSNRHLKTLLHLLANRPNALGMSCGRRRRPSVSIPLLGCVSWEGPVVIHCGHQRRGAGRGGVGRTPLMSNRPENEAHPYLTRINQDCASPAG